MRKFGKGILTASTLAVVGMLGVAEIEILSSSSAQPTATVPVSSVPQSDVALECTTPSGQKFVTHANTSGGQQGNACRQILALN